MSDPWAGIKAHLKQKLDEALAPTPDPREPVAPECSDASLLKWIEGLLLSVQGEWGSDPSDESMMQAVRERFSR